MSWIWFLSGQIGPNEPVRHFPITASPYAIGRRSDLALCLPRATVSGVHAEVVARGDAIVLRDLGSTNGTYVNGRRVDEPVVLGEDDLVQFADVAFRVRRQHLFYDGQTVTGDACQRAMALVQFDKMMNDRAVLPFYQPIVRLDCLSVMGYEVLGRSAISGLETPSEMFSAASQLDLEVELSCMLRWEGVHACAGVEPPVHLFVNTHPRELTSLELLDSLHAIRQLSTRQPVTLEIHEAAVTHPQSLHVLSAELRRLNMSLAFDDFGAGQTRLTELIESQPDYLKFDMSLIRNIHTGTPRRQQMLKALVQMTRELGVVALAEGIECQEEHEVCRQLGFQLGQGFFYGKPAPARHLGLAEDPSLPQFAASGTV